jgi:hypothetical protein
VITHIIIVILVSVGRNIGALKTFDVYLHARMDLFSIKDAILDLNAQWYYKTSWQPSLIM